MCDMIYSWTSAYVEPHLKLTSQVTPKMSYLYQQSVVTSKTIMKVFPMGLYFVYMPLSPFDDFAACIIISRRKCEVPKCLVMKSLLSPFFRNTSP